MSLSLFARGPRGMLLAASVSAVSLLAVTLVAVSIGGASGSGRKQSSRNRKQDKKRKRKIYLRGLYNLGNTCFLNSTLQSLASLAEFSVYLDSCLNFLLADGYTSSSSTDTAIAVQLKDVLDQLAPQSCKVSALSPRALISSLSKKGRWVSSMNEQDAHELFQMVSSTLQAARRESDASLFDSGFLSKSAPVGKSIISTSASASSSQRSDDSGKRTQSRSPSPTDVQVSYSGDTATCRMPPFSNPLLGMAASRIACVNCGYTAAIRHFTFDNLSLTVPRVGNTTIEACLAMYTVIDRLDDFKCRYCTLSATLAKIKSDIAHSKADLAELGESPKKAKRLAAAIEKLAKQQKEVEDALANNPEADLKGVPLVSPPPGVSTKQTMVARTPRILVLHLSRSIFLPTGDTMKNPARVRLQLLLDMSPFTTTGHISTNASKPISGPDTSSGLFAANALADAQRNNCLYRLCAVVVHAGTHHSGHFYAYRRIPTSGCASNGGAVHSAAKPQPLSDPGQWFRISDIDTTEVSLDTVLSAGDAYMLFYERL